MSDKEGKEEEIAEVFSYPTTPMETPTKKSKELQLDSKEELKATITDQEERIRSLEERLSKVNLAKLEKKKKKTRNLLEKTMDEEGENQDNSQKVVFDPEVKNKWDSMQRDLIQEYADKKKVYWVKYELEFIDSILEASTTHEILSAVEERISNLGIGLKFGWDTGAEKKSKFMDAFGVDEEQYDSFKRERKEARGEFLAMKAKMGKKSQYSPKGKLAQEDNNNQETKKVRGSDGLTDAQRRARINAKCFACQVNGHFKGDKGFPCAK